MKNYKQGEVIRTEHLPATSQAYEKTITLARRNSPYGNKKWHVQGKRKVDGVWHGAWSFYYDTQAEAHYAIDRDVVGHNDRI